MISRISDTPRPKSRVFIVDDHELVRIGLQEVIASSSDFEVCGQAEDYAGAMAQIVALAPDIALVDLSLKGGTGLELIRDLRTQVRSLRICVFSVHEELAYAYRTLRAGAAGYVMKGETPDCLLRTLRRVAAGQKAVSDRVIETMMDPLAGRRNDSLQLTDRQLEIVTLCGSGESTLQIAARLGISRKAVEVHRAKIRQMFGLKSGGELVQFCVQWMKREAGGSAPVPRLESSLPASINGDADHPALRAGQE